MQCQTAQCNSISTIRISETKNITVKTATLHCTWLETPLEDPCTRTHPYKYRCKISPRFCVLLDGWMDVVCSMLSFGRDFLAAVHRLRLNPTFPFIYNIRKRLYKSVFYDDKNTITVSFLRHNYLGILLHLEYYSILLKTHLNCNQYQFLPISLTHILWHACSLTFTPQQLLLQTFRSSPL